MWGQVCILKKGHRCEEQICVRGLILGGRRLTDTQFHRKGFIDNNTLSFFKGVLIRPEQDINTLFPNSLYLSLPDIISLGLFGVKNKLL